ncbi:hypothetical protein HID58_056805 [Brassica napus]|uniref:Uncharacterized protein n=1 Tax=Brassica napus TaxID=3708 RepID=A0ABQ8APC0_BRANA|nr:hypothetical protein HID58_056805 [Brassica napus]
MYSNQRFRLWTTLQKLAGNLGPFVKIVSFLGRGLKGLGFVTVNAQACICNRVYGYGGSSNLVAFCSTDLDSAPVLGGSGLRPSLTLAPTLEAPLLFSLLVFFCSSAAFVLLSPPCFSVFEAFLEAPSLERSSVSGVSPLVMDLRRDGSGARCRRSRRLGFWRRSLKPLLEFGCAWRRESSLCSDLISGLLDLRGSSVCLRHWGIGALSSSVASLTEGGGVYLFLRWWLVVGPEVWCWCWSSMVTPRRCCDLPPFCLYLPGFLPYLGFLTRRLEMMLKAPCGLRVSLVSSVAPSGVAHIPVLWASPWLLMVVSVALMLLAGLRAVQVLVQRSTCSRLLAYRSWFGSHCVSKPLASQGAFEDCIAGLGAIFNGLCFISLLHMCLCVMTVTVIRSQKVHRELATPKTSRKFLRGIRGNEVELHMRSGPQRHICDYSQLSDFVVKAHSTHSSFVSNSLSSSIEDLSFLDYLCVVCYAYDQEDV